MRVNYFREMKNHHMVVTAGDYLCPEYQMEMLKQSGIPGILSPAVRKINDETEYDYGITGYQSLQTLVEAEPVGGVLLSVLVRDLCRAMEGLEQHLIDPDYLTLQPAYIYLKRKEGIVMSASFCIFPFQERKAEEHLTELMKFVLDEVDYQEKAAVNLAYELFQLVNQEPVDFARMRELVQISDNQSGETAVKINGEIAAGEEGIGETGTGETINAADQKMELIKAEEILWIESLPQEKIKNRKGGGRRILSRLGVRS